MFGSLGCLSDCSSLNPAITFRIRSGPAGGGWIGFVIVEKFDRAAQEGSLVVQQQNFEAAPAAGQDIQPAIGVLFQDTIHRGACSRC